MFRGNVIRMLLGAPTDPMSFDPMYGKCGTDGEFEIWRWDDVGSMITEPVFKIDSFNGLANFDGLNVNIADGSLTVEGAPVVTSASLPALSCFCSGFINRPRSYSKWGSVSNGGFLASGPDAEASAAGSVALGEAIASGEYSIAAGVFEVEARGEGSLAVGLFNRSLASGSATTGVSNLVRSNASYWNVVGSSVMMIFPFVG